MVLAAALLAASHVTHAETTSRAETDENRLKTEFIERFTRFVEWPRQEGAAEPAEFVIGVVGDSSLAPFLEDFVRLNRVQKRPAVIRRVSSEATMGGVHVLFISHSTAAELAGVLSWVGDRPILTIGDSDGFASKGVMINFYREGDYLRFEINAQAATRVGLMISSRLLRLAREVK